MPVDAPPTVSSPPTSGGLPGPGVPGPNGSVPGVPGPGGPGGGMTPPVGGGLPGRANPVGKQQAAMRNVALGVGFLMMGLRDLDAGSDLGLSIHKFINDIRKQIPDQETLSSDAQKLMALRQRAMRPGPPGMAVPPGGGPPPMGGPPGGAAAGAPPPGPPPVPAGGM